MSSKRKRDSEEIVPFTPPAKQMKQDEVTRSGRVRKKPAKFVDDETDEDIKPDVKPEVSKLPRSPPVVVTPSHTPEPAVVTSPPPPARAPMISTSPEIEMKEERDDDWGKSASRSSRARKKSAKVIEMEEFEEAEKKQAKKDAAKKPKSPVAHNIVGSPQEPQPGQLVNLPIPILKIKDIPTTPKVETVAPLTVQISQQKSPVAGSSKSPVAYQIAPGKSPESKASVIKLLLSSPAQNTKPAINTSSVAHSPPIPEAKGSSKKGKISKKLHGKQTSPGSTESSQPGTSGIKAEQEVGLDYGTMTAKSEPGTSKIKVEGDLEAAAVGMPMISKDTKVKKTSKKRSESEHADESPFLPPPAPSPNVIHVGPMNIGLEVKQESDAKRKKVKTDMSDQMMNDEYSLDMPEIELGDPGSDSFMEMEDEDSLMMPEEEVVATERSRSEGKKKAGKGKKKNVNVQLGDIPTTDGELVMDFSRMKSDDKKKKKEKSPKEDLEASRKKRAPTAYMMWCSANRQRLVNDNPGMDFSTISKTLGEMWSNLSEKDKMVWKRKAKKAAGKGSTLITTGKTIITPKIPGSQTVTTARQMAVTQKTNPALAQSLLASRQMKQQPVDDINTPIKGFGMEPLDVAAHLKIVGEALSIIGMKLQEHRGLIAVQGSLSVLLDAFMCSVTPLMCLTAVLPETNGLSPETHLNSLDNIAYFMPGL